MKVEITLKEAYARASKGLRHKMAYSIRLLQKAEKLALAYDSRGGVLPGFQRWKRLSGPLSYRSTGRRTIPGTHESYFGRSSRGHPLRQKAIS